MLLRDRLNTFRRDERGSPAFEAIWVGLFLSYMIIPSMYLMEFSEIHMDGSWGQRSAARYDAINSNNLLALGGCEIPVLPATIDVGTHGGSLILCTKGDIAEPLNNRFWKKLEGAASNGGFPTLLDDMKDEGEIGVYRSSRTTGMTRAIEIGDGSGGKNVTNGDGFIADLQDAIDSASLPTARVRMLLDRPKALAPSTDYYKGNKPHWQKGHDARIWADLNDRNKRLFPKVFPSNLP